MVLFSSGKALFDAYAQQKYAKCTSQPVDIDSRRQQGSGKGCRYARRDAPKGSSPLDQTIFTM